MNSVKLILFKHQPITFVVYFSDFLGVEGSVRSCDWGLQNLNFLGSDGLGDGGLGDGLFSISSSTLRGSCFVGDFFARLLGCRVISELDVERLLSGIGSSGWDNISLGDITGGLVRSTSSRVLIVVRNGGNLFLLTS